MVIYFDTKIRHQSYCRGLCKKQYGYGTAGFREKAEELPMIVYRMGILAALRSLSKSGQAIGVMITASHNPEWDNGVKLIDPSGGMLDFEWECIATSFVNASDEDFDHLIKDVISAKCDCEMFNTTSQVHCAHDTRVSSTFLLEAVKCGVSTVSGVEFVSHGLLTTPQLHFIIKTINSNCSYGLPTENGYYSKYSQAFNTMLNFTPVTLNGQLRKYDQVLYVDVANGVGGQNFEKLTQFIDKTEFEVRLMNFNDGPLNKECGADFVKTERKVPKIHAGNCAVQPLQKWCSFDGDADRVVYYFLDSNNIFHLLDGDKIAVLFAGYVSELLDQIELDPRPTCGFVQTAYANGNSTRYVQNHFPALKVYCVPTGVKHLHKQAEELDVGVYFEANGHGTILFSERLKCDLQAVSEHKINEKRMAARQLLTFIDLINESIGDAMADVLAIETVLRQKDMSMNDWDSFYTDIPSKHMKVTVSDRRVIETTDAERLCTKPASLQGLIDQSVSMFQNSRAFVRPSGTEDIVRIYAEASTEDDVLQLAALVAGHVYDVAGGVGERPRI